MQATTDHPAQAKLDRAGEALGTLIELRDWVPDSDDGLRGFALAQIIGNWNADTDDPIWVALAALIPPRRHEAVDEACEKIRRATVDLLEALWDDESERRDSEGLSLATYEKLRRAHANIGQTLDRIRLEA